MDFFESFLAEQLQRPEFRKEWEALEKEYEIQRQLILSQITPDNIHDEVSTGEPVGKEAVVYNMPPKQILCRPLRRPKLNYER